MELRDVSLLIRTEAAEVLKKVCVHTKGEREGEVYLEWDGAQSLVVYGNFPEIGLV